MLQEKSYITRAAEKCPQENEKIQSNVLSRKTSALVHTHTGILLFLIFKIMPETATITPALTNDHTVLWSYTHCPSVPTVRSGCLHISAWLLVL